MSAPDRTRRTWRCLRAAVQEHPVFAVVLLVAALLRLATEIAYWPALTFADSWSYIDAAYGAFPFDFVPERPSGYPFLLHLLALPGRELAVITLTQHLAGLATGAVTYALLIRLDIDRTLAALAAGLVLLDAYAIALEQMVLSEAFFTLTIALSLFLVIGGEPSGRPIALSGALLALAATMRPVALLLIPVWLAYVAWAHRRPLLVGVGCLAIALPLVAYSVFHSAQTGRGGVAEQDGWVLYGRVGPIADCRGADIPPASRRLCQPAAQRVRDSDFYVWNERSLARAVFGGGSIERQAEVNTMLRDFAVGIARAHPGAYLSLAGEDFLELFTPGGRGLDVTVKLPEPKPGPAGVGRIPGPCRACDGYAEVVVDPVLRDRWFPDYEPSVRAPSAALVSYGEIAHTPRWLMAIFAVMGLAAVAVGLARREAVPHRREIFLLLGAGMAMTAGSAATVNPWLRYLLPAVPVLVCGGVLAGSDLWAMVRAAFNGAGPHRGRRAAR